MKNNLVPPNLVPTLERNLSAYEYRMLTETNLTSPPENIVEMIKVLVKVIGGNANQMPTPFGHMTQPPIVDFMPESFVNQMGYDYNATSQTLQPTTNPLDMTDLINMMGGQSYENNDV